MKGNVQALAVPGQGEPAGGPRHRAERQLPPEALATLYGQPVGGRPYFRPWMPGTGKAGPGPVTDRDPLSATAASPRHVPPGALPVSAVSALEPDGPDATG